MHNTIAHHQLTNTHSILEQQHPPSRLPQCHCPAWRHMVWDISLASWGQLCWFCPLPAPCALPAPQWWCHTRSRKGPDYVSTALQRWKHQCFISAIFILKYRTIPATMERKNSLSAKTRTRSFLNSTKWSETINKLKSCRITHFHYCCHESESSCWPC